MSEEKKEKELTLHEIAQDMQKAAIEYYRSNSVEDDERREAEKDARVKAALEKLAREGKLPPPLPKKAE